MELRNEALCAPGKTGRTRLQIDIFWRKFYEPNFLHLLIPRKALKSLMETSVPCDLIASFSCLVATLYQDVCLGGRHTPIAKAIYILTSPATSSKQFLRAIWEAVPQAIVLSKPQTKLNSQLSRCTFFFSSQQFWQPQSEPEQTSLLCLNSVRIWALVSTEASCAHSPPRRVQKNLGESFLVLRSSDYRLMILSFIWRV